MIPHIEVRLQQLISQPTYERVLATDVKNGNPVWLSDNLPIFRTTHEFLKRAGFSTSKATYTFWLIFKQRIYPEGTRTKLEEDIGQVPIKQEKAIKVKQEKKHRTIKKEIKKEKTPKKQEKLLTNQGNQHRTKSSYKKLKDTQLDEEEDELIPLQDFVRSTSLRPTTPLSPQQETDDIELEGSNQINTVRKRGISQVSLNSPERAQTIVRTGYGLRSITSTTARNEFHDK